ncbi:MAG: YIP1 family protein [Nitrospiraceae bacterium]|nr:YIP1 family protein [Nitrospira sp.]MCA9455155.1 YIP1 family protein [Nitrospira sp.]MCB9772739.1 YIP1 family protein [Nitrospiraceae bacterium]
MSLFVDRMIRAAKLDVHLYEEVEADRRSMGQAMGVVLLSSLAGGIGFMQEAGLMGLVIGTVGSLLGWYVWALMTYLIGTKLLPEPQTHADHGELLRTIGFSSAPGLIRVFGIIPALSGFVNLLAGVWMLVAMVIAVRQALDFQSTYRAIGVCLIGWIIQAILLALLVTTMGGVPELMLEPP